MRTPFLIRVTHQPGKYEELGAVQVIDRRVAPQTSLAVVVVAVVATLLAFDVALYGDGGHRMRVSVRVRGRGRVRKRGKV